MNRKVLKTLEYNKIIDKLSLAASSLPGKALCSKLLPVDSLSQIQKSQRETADALSRILKKGSISFSGVCDITPSLMRLEVGSSLGPAELLHIGSLLDTAAKVKNYGRTDVEREQSDSLGERFDSIEPLTPFNNELKRCIISEEEISDDASPALKDIRRSIRNANDKIHGQLGSLLNSSSTRTMLQDALITMRNGRYCLPVKQEYRNRFPGMIHDQSSSGSTLFIEPMSVVKLNNDLKELSVKEQDEIEKILARLSSEASEHTDELKYDLDILAELDFIFAKASLARQMKATEPDFNENGIIDIKKGRHPLIDPLSVVPIDVSLGKTFDLLVITGPNTGGKTVTLKTIGLFTLMGQAGLHIPAFDHSSLGVFREVYADIGDEQSIEQSLSTFSSHMKNTVTILKEADDHSLALFDELGAGTDPTEGAALAMSILSHLHQSGVKTAATTHYSELKTFALTTPGVENACCEFDVASLRPTYRLLIGIPGKSNAFAISGKLGLPDFIIRNAGEFIDAQDKNFEDLLSDLESKRISMEKEKAEIERYKNEINELKSRLKVKNEKLEASREKMLKEAKEQANKILSDAKDYADKTIKQYNKWSEESGLNRKMEQERAKLREKLKETETGLSMNVNKKPSKKYKPSDFKLGDSVKVLSLNLNGIVSSLPNAKGDLYVQMGILRSLVNIKDLDLIEEPAVTGPGTSKTGSGKIKMSKSASISPEINVIGKTVDEAVSILNKYLDDAYLSHLPQVTIIHGRGTGALRSGIQQFLKRNSYIKSFRSGEFGEGGQGVTIVEFK